LRVPAGAKRTFALVGDKTAPEAKRVRYKVDSAIALGYPEPITIGDRQEKAGALRVATAVAKNTVDRTPSVGVACSFHDDGGKVLGRPFVVADMPPGANQTLRFEGPPGATRGEIFVVQVAFKP